MKRTLLLLFVYACGSDATLIPFEEWQGTRPIPDDFTLLDEGSSEGGPITLSFDVAPGTTSLEIVASTLSNRFVQLTSLRGPSGELIPEQPDGVREGVAAQLTNGFPETRDLPNFVLARMADAAFRYPNDAMTVLEPGTWSVEVSPFIVDREVTRESVRVERRRADAPMHARVIGRAAARELGAIDLHLLIGANTGLSGESALENAQLMEALAVVDEVFAQVNIRVRDVVATDAPDFPTVLALENDTCDPSRALRELVESTPVQEGYVPIAIVGTFQCLVDTGLERVDFGPQFGGFSPGIPGIFTAQGEALVMSVALIDRFPLAWQRILAHEIGHFLGLLHVVQTVAGENLFPDNLSDTPDGSGEETPRANLMFPNVDQIIVDALTPQQGVVMRQSPYVRAIE